MMNADIEDRVLRRAQPVLDSFYDAVLACGRTPSAKPRVRVSLAPGVPHYDHGEQAVVLFPWETLPPPQRAGMEASAEAGTLGLTPPEQYAEMFNELLVAHELGHWLQMVAMVPIDRWTAEYDANRIMVAFWREHPAPNAKWSSEERFINFAAHGAGLVSPIPPEFEDEPQSYFNANIDALERDPRGYAWYQKMMVRRAAAERPPPSFSDMVNTIWPEA